MNLGDQDLEQCRHQAREDLDTVGAEAWTDRGLVVLGVPVGHRAFVQKWLAERAVTCAVSQSDPSGPRHAECMVAS